MPPTDMTLEQVTDDVAKRLNLERFLHLSTPEGKAVFVRAVNEEIEAVKDKIREVALGDLPAKLTAAEQSIVELQAKLQRRQAYDRDYGVHVGADGKIKPNVSPETARYLATDFRDLIRALHGKDSEKVRALSTTVAGEGGVFVPTEVSTEIIRLIPETGIYPRIARDVTMGAGDLNIGAVIGGMTAYWVDQNALITPSYPGFDKIVLSAKKLGAYIPVPMELIDDAVINVGQLIADLIVECLSLEIDRVGITGKSALNGGTDLFDGLLWSAGLQVLDMTSTSMSGLDFDLALDMQTKPPDGARENASYILSTTYFNWLRKQKMSTGDYIYQRPDAGMPGLLWGKPYSLTERMPTFTSTATPGTKVLLYGDWKRFAFYGHRNIMNIATSDVAGEAFQRDQIAVRGITRVGFASYGPGFAALKTAP
jgi:HK97 family phage major capsid protein